nr:leucine-rich repeat-containing protein C10orf11 homolog [Odocoileus virginianus texanus]
MAGLVVSGTQVSYIGQDCREIPEHLGRDCGHFAKRLDLSFNLLRPMRHVRKLLERKRENQQVCWGPLGMLLWMTPLLKDLLNPR